MHATVFPGKTVKNGTLTPPVSVGESQKVKKERRALAKWNESVAEMMAHGKANRVGSYYRGSWKERERGREREDEKSETITKKMRRRGKRGWNEPNGERRQHEECPWGKKCRSKKNGATTNGERIENCMNVRERKREKKKEKEDAMRYDKIQRDKMNWWNQVKARSNTN